MKNMFALIICLLLTADTNAQSEACTTNQDIKAQANLVLYPNPVSDIVYIEHTRPVAEILIFDMLWQVLGEFKTTRNRNYVLDISELPDGMYFIRVCDIENNIYSQKVIKSNL
jgi:hypothetical protein